MQINGISTSPGLAGSVETAKNKTNSDFVKKMAEATGDNSSQKKLKGACVEFEAMFLNLMYGEMRKSVNEQDGLLPKTQAEKIMQSMLDEELTKNMAKAGGVGLADVLYKQLSFEESSKKNKNTIDTRL